MMVTLAFFSDIGGGEMLIVAVIALLLFGKNLPTQARNIGKTIAQFKSAINAASSELKKEMDNAADELDRAAKAAELDKQADDLKKLQDDFNKPPQISENTSNSTPAESIPVEPEKPLSLDKRNADLSPLAAAPEKTSRAPAAVSSAASLDNLERNIPPPNKIPPPLG
ncbi:MAG TPA: twin-arginine translocase TatA/TatE family subunit [Planctomycetota bacterium]|nr:twin-arginine translocase TatA/TatE family subunit [Planctomycetota bacterium]